MCTGHPPFRASGTHAVLKRVIDASPRPIREVNNEIPDWLCAIITKLHAKMPEDRFQTAREVADLLGQYLAELQRHGDVSVTSAAVSAPRDAGNRPVQEVAAPGTSSSFLGRKLLTRAALFLLLIAFSFWPGQWLWRAVRNTGYMWLRSDAAQIKLVLSRDGQIVKEFGSGYTGFGAAPGEYTCEATYDKTRWACEFDFQTDSLLSGSGATKKTDKLSFPIRRGDYLQLGVRLVPVGPHVAVKKIAIKEPTPDEPGWVQLFNGKDFTNWPVYKGAWKIVDNAIVADGPGLLEEGRNITKNFNLRLQAKVKRGDAILRFRSANHNRGWTVRLEASKKNGIVSGTLIKDSQPNLTGCGALLPNSTSGSISKSRRSTMSCISKSMV